MTVHMGNVKKHTKITTGYSNKMTKVKICGLSRSEDIEAVNRYGADYAGFVFFEKSKRNVSCAQAEKLLKQLRQNTNIQSVAVCVSPDMEKIRQLQNMGFDLIQIHGTIPTDCLSDGGLALWQAVNIAKEQIFHTNRKTSRQKNHNESILGGRALQSLDKPTITTKLGMTETSFLQAPNIKGYVVDAAEYGSGKTFGWENENFVADFLNDIKITLQNRQFILAGGLNTENVQTGIRLFHPDVVDVSSGVECDGVKDAALIREFIRKVRES